MEVGPSAAARGRPRGIHAVADGLGERSHLANPDIDLYTHAQDVVGTLEFEDLRDVVLVGHSYGGIVITVAAERVPDRVSHLVHLDAEVPEDGQAEIDLVSDEERSQVHEAAGGNGGWQIPPPVPDPLPPDLPPDVHWVLSRMRPQPLRTYTQPVRLSGPPPPVRRTYVLHTEGKEGQELPAYVERVRSDAQWQFLELAAGHAAHVMAPRQLADLLIGLS